MGSLSHPEIDPKSSLQANSNFRRSRGRTDSSSYVHDDHDHSSVHAGAGLRGMLAELGGQSTEDHRGGRRYQQLPRGVTNLLPIRCTQLFPNISATCGGTLYAKVVGDMAVVRLLQTNRLLFLTSFLATNWCLR